MSFPIRKIGMLEIPKIAMLSTKEFRSSISKFPPISIFVLIINIVILIVQNIDIIGQKIRRVNRLRAPSSPTQAFWLLDVFSRNWSFFVHTEDTSRPHPTCNSHSVPIPQASSIR